MAAFGEREIWNAAASGGSAEARGSSATSSEPVAGRAERAISQIEMERAGGFFSRRLTVIRSAFIRVYRGPPVQKEKRTGAYKRQGNIARCRRAKIYCRALCALSRAGGRARNTQSGRVSKGRNRERERERERERGPFVASAVHARPTKGGGKGRKLGTGGIGRKGVEELEERKMRKVDGERGCEANEWLRKENNGGAEEERSWTYWMLFPSCWKRACRAWGRVGRLRIEEENRRIEDRRR